MLPKLAVILFALAFAPPLAAQEVDGVLNLGDAYEGVVQDAEDLDIVEFAGLAGETVTLTLSRGKGSLLNAHVSVVHPEAEAVLIEVDADEKGKAVLVLTLAETDVFELRVSGIAGSTGAFKVKSKAKVDKAALAPAGEPGAGDPGSVEVDFSAKPGALLSATVKPAKGTDALPGALLLTGPSGPVDVSAFTSLSGTTLKVKNAPLPELGVYVLVVENDGTGGQLEAAVKLKLAKAKKKTVVDSIFSLALADSIPLATTSGKASFVVSGSLLDLGGSGLPKTVEWSRSAAAGAKAGSLKVKNGTFTGKVALLPGDNVVLLSANGLAAEIEIEVTHNKGYDFGGTLQVAPDLFYVSEAKSLTAQIALTDTDTNPAAVSLVRLEAGVEVVVGTMTDDGSLVVGDEIAGDRLYTLKKSLTLTMEELAGLRVVVGLLKSGEARSEIARVLATDHLSDAELTQILNKQNSQQALLDQAVIDGDVPETVDEVLADLQADPLVIQAGKSESGLGVWAVYQEGIASVVYAPEPDVKSGGVASAAPAPASDRGPPPLVMDAAPPYLGWFDGPAPELPEGALAAAPPNLVKNNRAKVIAEQFWDWGNGDDIPEMDQMLQDHGCFDVTSVYNNAKGGGSVEAFKSLGQYGVVLISTHGDTFYKGILSFWKDAYKWTGPGAQVVVLSDLPVTLANKATYEADLKAGRLILWGNRYAMTPVFFRHYNGVMPNSLVYMSICRGTWNGTLADAFLSTGAGAFLGYSDYVAVSFTKANGPPLLEALLMPDMTLDDVFTPGIKETDASPAEFRLFGSKTLGLAPGSLEDGGFESGVISQSWVPAGDARIIPYLGGFAPTEGDLMGIISTGLGFTVDSGSITQTLCLPEDVSTLRFDWNFLSEEFPEYCFKGYIDTFFVKFTEVGNPTNTYTPLYEYVDSLCGGTFPVAVDFDQGDVEATGWNSANLGIPPSLAGKKVTLEFGCFDVGDSIYDTAILIDDIRID